MYCPLEGDGEWQLREVRVFCGVVQDASEGVVPSREQVASHRVYLKHPEFYPRQGTRVPDEAQLPLHKAECGYTQLSPKQPGAQQAQLDRVSRWRIFLQWVFGVAHRGKALPLPVL
jgi:hypothetical protein